MAVRSVKKKHRTRRTPKAKPFSGGVVADEMPRPIVPAKRRIALPVVGVGASAGGLEALEELFDHMPADTGMAFVIVTHQHPGHTSMLPALLGKGTSIAVVEAVNGTKLEPNHIYVGPPGGHLSILHGRLHRMETGMKEAPKLPIDHFFRSLAEDLKERAIGIVLSGTGTDGTLGLKAIKSAYGMAMVQQPQSAKFAGMPSSAIATGLADYVLPPAAMPSQLLAYARGPYLTGATVAAELPAMPEEPMQKIFVLLRSRTGHDFSAYKRNTLHRRIERRMNVHQIEKPDRVRPLPAGEPARDRRAVQGAPDRRDQFLPRPRGMGGAAAPHPRGSGPGAAGESRDSGLGARLLPPGRRPIRMAIAAAGSDGARPTGTSTCRSSPPIWTRMRSKRLEPAIYPGGIEADVSPKRLERYFLRDDGTYRVRKEIREMVVFAAAERDQGSAVHQARHPLLPQSADIPQRESAEEASAAVPLRPQTRRPAVSRDLGDRRRAHRPVRPSGQALEDLRAQGEPRGGTPASGDSRPAGDGGQRRGIPGGSPSARERRPHFDGDREIAPAPRFAPASVGGERERRHRLHPRTHRGIWSPRRASRGTTFSTWPAKGCGRAARRHPRMRRQRGGGHAGRHPGQGQRTRGPSQIFRSRPSENRKPSRGLLLVTFRPTAAALLEAPKARRSQSEARGRPPRRASGACESNT